MPRQSFEVIYSLWKLTSCHFMEAYLLFFWEKRILEVVAVGETATLTVEVLDTFPVMEKERDTGSNRW